MPLVDEHGRLIGRFESAEHFIMANSRLCTECNELRVNYELHKDGVCIYCREENDDEA